jgi:hypothetical protein
MREVEIPWCKILYHTEKKAAEKERHSFITGILENWT